MSIENRRATSPSIGGCSNLTSSAQQSMGKSFFFSKFLDRIKTENRNFKIPFFNSTFPTYVRIGLYLFLQIPAMGFRVKTNKSMIDLLNLSLIHPWKELMEQYFCMAKQGLERLIQCLEILALRFKSKFLVKILQQDQVIFSQDHHPLAHKVQEN